MQFRAGLAFDAFTALMGGRLAQSFFPADHQTVGVSRAKSQRKQAGAACVRTIAIAPTTIHRTSGVEMAGRYAALLTLGMLSLGAEHDMAVAEPVHVVLPDAVERHAAHIAEASQRFGIPERWIRAVLGAESAGDVRAVSPAGAIGLMQVMPTTWTELRARHDLGRDPYDPRDNILAGAAYLRKMFDRYGSVAAMLAAYNAGPGRYEEYLATGRALPAETRAYVAALVPVLGGAAASEPRSSAPPPPDWREAPLFVMRSGDVSATAAPLSEGQSGDARSAVPARDPADRESQSGSIFVVRASDG